MFVKLIKFILFIGLMYAGACAYLYYKQRSMMYLPATTRPVQQGEAVDNFIDMTVRTSDSLTLHSWYHLADPDMPTILYFHGNAGDISSRAPQVTPYLQKGYGVLLLEYRGYGGNPGQPTEQGLYMDGRAAMTILKQFNVPPEKVILYGESLGTAVAVQMASEYPVKGVVLQSPFDSMVNLASEIYRQFPVKWLLLDRYDSVNKIKHIKVPLLILHGTEDTTVPIRFGKNLYAHANDPKLWIEYPGRGHGDIVMPQMQNDVLQFLQVLQN